MKKPIHRKVLALLIFITVGFFASHLYLKFNLTESKKLLLQFNENSIRVTCPHSPERSKYQECFRQILGSTLSMASPTDLLFIKEKISELKEKDLFLSDTQEKTFLAKLLYFENTIIFFDHSKELKLARNTISFIDIIYIPYVKEEIRSNIEKVSKEFMLFDKNVTKQLRDKYSSRINLVKGRMF